MQDIKEEIKKLVPSPNDWIRYKELVLHELENISEKLEKINTDIIFIKSNNITREENNSVKKELNNLKVNFIELKTRIYFYGVGLIALFTILRELILK